MKVREVMTSDPICCVPSDTVQTVANIMCDRNVGSIPIVADQHSRKLTGIITDRDLCCSIIAQGLDPKTTRIQRYMRPNPVACRDGEDLNGCEHVMQKHQIRRIPVIDDEGRCVGIVAQADLALKEKSEKLSQTVTEISRPQATTA